ncbi:MAG: CDP-diacylglycerol--serine O-phosphatidyltransferase [Marinilabiliales bacterium]|nr:MAG: CDP-diacylglycerol--serine O-phosphatidyltransferase [Marinilabiliales bacterium]
MKITKAIPSTITSLNLLSGTLSVVFAFRGDIEIAALFVIIASFFDFFDGLSARLLKAVSEFCKQLDSLADLISFGMAPASILYNLFILQNHNHKLLAYSVFLIVVFSALRLAKFNIDPDQTTEFKGLPTPASALVVISIAYYCFNNNTELATLFSNPYMLVGISIILSGLMVSNLKLISLKIKTFEFSKIFLHVILLIGGIILLIIFKSLGIGLTIILYLAISFLKQILTKKH